MANQSDYSVVTGDVNGHLSEVFQKLGKLHEKQSFAFAIIAGNLFSAPETTSEQESLEIQGLLKGSIQVPLPTYFSIGTHALPLAVIEKLQSNGGEVCPNLSVLGRNVSIKTLDGFRIAAIGGSHNTSSSSTPTAHDAIYSDTDVQALAKDSLDVDILVTSEWPAAVRDGSKASYAGTESPAGVNVLSELCMAIAPRYHFSTSDSFYEREPFFHVGELPRKLTRFISLAPYGNAAKQKWIYAFSLQPGAPPPQQLPQGHTASPFRIVRKRKANEAPDSSTNFRYFNGNGTADTGYDRGPRKRQRHQVPLTPSECFFCLSNDSNETHMITSIGDECYTTVAKGPLTTPSMFPDLGFPCHILLIPLQHAPAINSISDQKTRASSIAELQRYRKALHDMLRDKAPDEDGKSKLGAVTWEISRARGVHVHWQFLPVPAEMVTKGLVEAAFDVEAENLSFPKFEKKAAQMADVEEGDYFKVMIWSETLRKEMTLPINESYRFDLQFGRRVLAKLLGLESRIDWRGCIQQKAEEEADVARFKEAFKDFDFTLE